MKHIWKQNIDRSSVKINQLLYLQLDRTKGQTVAARGKMIDTLWVTINRSNRERYRYRGKIYHLEYNRGSGEWQNLGYEVI